MRLSVLALAGAIFTTLILAPAASAERVPCVVGQKAPKCKAWTAKVKHVDDGDTLKPQIWLGKKKGWSEKTSVRVIGLNAPELSDYTHKARKGNCLGVQASEAFERLIGRREFRLVALHGSSKTHGGRARLRRTIQAKRGGKWIDPAMVLLEKGLALWLGNGKEWPWNATYSRLTQEAAARGRGIWNPVACGKPGPSQDSPLSLKVKWDGNGTDTPNSEWVRIKNGDPVNDVSLRGWTLRDSHLRGEKMRSGYQFPATAVVPAGSSIIVRAGRGSNTADTFYWGLGETPFGNATDDKRQIGDGAYLFDPDSEMRAFMQYPCRPPCADALDNKVSLKARYLGLEHEWVTVTNASPAPISLNEYEIENTPWFYEFGPRDVLAPGQSLTLWVRSPHPVPVGDPGRRLTVEPVPGLSIPGLTDFATSVDFRSWNYDNGMFADGGDVVVLRTPNGAPVLGACDTWGGKRCPNI
jgi:endonuclease YncB( thermonuclease family)